MMRSREDAKTQRSGNGTGALKQVVVRGGFDDMRSADLRFLQEAARLGEVTALLEPDCSVKEETGRAPKFPLSERLYFLRAVRFIRRVVVLPEGQDPNTLPSLPGIRPDVWVDPQHLAGGARENFCRQIGMAYHILPRADLAGFPELPPQPGSTGRKKVIVTGCYDWVHSGHVRFFEEVSTYGDLYVVIGHDANIRLLKGEGHPLLKQDERRYLTGCIRYVTQSLISTGQGWLDAEPEIQRIRPDIYAVNEDGDKGGKREYCAKLGIEYLVLKRTPAPGLPARSSTDLRGF